MPIGALFLTALALDAMITLACFPLGLCAFAATSLLVLMAEEA